MVLKHHEALLGVFEDSPSIPGGIDVKCPICGDNSPPAWQTFQTFAPGGGPQIAGLPSGLTPNGEVYLDWMRCSNEECEELIVRVHEQRPQLEGQAFVGMQTDTWMARPRFGTAKRRINSLVPEPFRADYAEAAAILEISHRMSAVLSRRILGDLLKKYASKDQRNLAAQIDAFTEESGHPSRLTSNLHHFREVANFGAHTQEDQREVEGEPSVIDVDRDEAEWTLDMVDRLFDYFIVQPAKDEEIRSRMDEKIQRAGRKPLRSDEPEDAEQS